MPARVLLLAWLLLACIGAAGVHAQPATAPRIVAAEQAFTRGLALYERGDFRAAYEAFRRAAEDYAFHERTTAAALMAGKALYAAGELEEAISAMTRFVAAYPASRYVEEARAVRRAALAARDRRPTPPTPYILGIALPLAEADRPFTQALFNGLRLAVEEHNARAERPVQMVFRDCGTDERAARAAVEALHRAGADVVVGPLYSEQALAAGAEAERLGLTLVAPLATDDRVARDRRFVFQANPPFAVRGRFAAAFVLERGLGRVGVVAERGTFAETMAEAFVAEAAREGRPVAFFERLPSEEAWFQLGERVGPERLAGVDALYLPLTAPGDQPLAILRALGRTLGATARPPILLGSGEWASARPSAQDRVLYVADFFLRPEDAPRRAPFVERYRTLADAEPDRLAYLGYDLGRLLLERLGARRDGEPLAETLRRGPAYEGLGHRLDFRGGQTNQALFLVALDVHGPVLVE